MIKEACVETINQCIRAEKQGADRIELCADLLNDGLTPSHQTIATVADQLTIPVRVMIRPRAGNFVYTKDEIHQMKLDIDFCKNIGVEGVVLGVCTHEATLDISTIAELADFASPLKVTIHKAIDHCNSPENELEKLNRLENINAVLTSGQGKTAKEGMVCLKSLLSIASPHIEIIPCGKITQENINDIHHILKAKAYHGKLIVGDLG